MSFLIQTKTQTLMQEIDDRSFSELSDSVYSHSGIVLPASKKNLLVSRISKRLRQLGLESYSEYCSLLRSKSGIEERQNLTSLVTTNVTKFFRESHHFEALKREVLPGLIETAKNGGRVRIWSAGCSTGEEPYSIAIQLLESCADVHKYDVRVLGTDIDQKVIKTASEGTYPESAKGSIEGSIWNRHFLESTRSDSSVEVHENVRKLITFRKLNLLEDWPMTGAFDVIFCRNVAIYFDQETQERLWARFAGKLLPSGSLFIGHSERINLQNIPELSHAGITQYRRS